MVTVLPAKVRSARATAHRTGQAAPIRQPVSCVTDIDRRLARQWSVATALFAQCGERRDLPDELGPQRPGQVVTHAGEPNEAGVGDCLGEREAAAGRDQRVMEPVDDQRWDSDAAQRRGAVLLADRRRELAAVPGLSWAKLVRTRLAVFAVDGLAEV